MSTVVDQIEELKKALAERDAAIAAKNVENIALVQKLAKKKDKIRQLKNPLPQMPKPDIQEASQRAPEASSNVGNSQAKKKVKRKKITDNSQSGGEAVNEGVQKENSDANDLQAKKKVKRKEMTDNPQAGSKDVNKEVQKESSDANEPQIKRKVKKQKAADNVQTDIKEVNEETREESGCSLRFISNGVENYAEAIKRGDEIIIASNDGEPIIFYKSISGEIDKFPCGDNLKYIFLCLPPDGNILPKNDYLETYKQVYEAIISKGGCMQGNSKKKIENKVENEQIKRECSYVSTDSKEVSVKKIERLLEFIDTPRTKSKKEENEIVDLLIENANGANIEILNLQGKKITNKSAKALSRMLSSNCTLESLNVSYNKISVEGAKVLASALGKNKTLKELDISHNDIKDSGAKSFATAIGKNPSLQFLHLENNKIRNEGARALSSEYRKNFTLKALTLVGIDNAGENTSFDSGTIDEITKLMERNNAGQALLDCREMRIGEVVGSGSYGIVYKGIFRNHKVAIKQLDPEKSSQVGCKLRLITSNELKKYSDAIKKGDEIIIMSVNGEVTIFYKKIIDDVRLYKFNCSEDMKHALLSLPFVGNILPKNKNPEIYKQIYQEVTSRAGCTCSVKEIQRFEKEANIMAQFNYENVVKFYGYYKAPCYSIVMEYADLKSLSSFLENSPKMRIFPEKIILALDMANGLNYIHSKKILHRDFKPGNVLLVEDATKIIAKISDFGFSSHISEVSSARKAAGRSKRGSGNYKAPEIRGVKSPAQRHTEAADVYSYGATLFTLFFEVKKLPAHIDQSVVEKFNNVDAQLKALIVDCCNPDPTLRAELSDVIKKLDAMMNYRTLPHPACSSPSSAAPSPSSSSLAPEHSGASMCDQLSSVKREFEKLGDPPLPKPVSAQPPLLVPSYTTTLRSSPSLASSTKASQIDKERSSLLKILDSMLTSKPGEYKLEKAEGNKWYIKKIIGERAEHIEKLRIINETQIEFFYSEASGGRYLLLTSDSKYSSLFSCGTRPQATIKRKLPTGAGSVPSST